jgi:hypothetical protein
MPAEETFDAIIDVLQIANEGLLDAQLAARVVPDALALTNQVPFLDDQGRLHVLGRTLRASATRLTDPFPQLVARRRLEYFRGSLAGVDRLVAIGYSFADAEVDEIVHEWLAGSPARRLEIVAPGVQQVPALLEPLAERIEVAPASATTYLERFV